MSHATGWMDMEGVRLSKLGQRRKDTLCDSALSAWNAASRGVGGGVGLPHGAELLCGEMEKSGECAQLRECTHRTRTNGVGGRFYRRCILLQLKYYYPSCL